MTSACRSTVTSLPVSVVLNRQQQLEQERLDRELALRLAAEDQSQVEEVTREPLNRCVHHHTTSSHDIIT